MPLARQDLLQAARTLARHPGFAIVAILSLALAIALNTTMYSVLDALVNPATKIVKPEQLYSFGYFGDRRQLIPAQTRNAMLRAGGRSYQALTFTAPWAYYQALIEHGQSNIRGNVATVAPDYFKVLGVRAREGRSFVDDDVTASERPILLSDHLARHLFPDGRSPIGARIKVEDGAFLVIGVMDRGSDFEGYGRDAWVIPPPDRPIAGYGCNILRLRDGATRAQADAELRVIAAQMANAVGENQRDNGFLLGSMLARQFHLNNFHYALIGAVLAVLLVACANLANLQLARGLTRSRELATRAALGAGRRDLIQHLMTEAGLLGAAGLALGLVLTFWTMQLVTASIPESIGDYLVEPQTSWRLFAFATVAALVCLVLIGLLPAIRVSRVDLNDLIKSGNGTGSFRRSRQQYGILLAAEMGFALVVACGTSLLIRSARQIAGDNVGYDTAPLVTGMMIVPIPRSAPAPSYMALAAEFAARVRATPGLADGSLIAGHSGGGEVTATDSVGGLRVAPAPNWGYSIVSPSYFRTYGIPMLHGRDFLEGEQGRMAIVDPATARTLWPTSSAIGQMIKFGSPGSAGSWYTVVGVAAPTGTPGAPAEQVPMPTSRKPTTKTGAHFLIDGRERSVYATAAAPPGKVYVLPTTDDTLSSNQTSQTPNRTMLSFIVRAKRDPAHAPLAMRHAFAGDARMRLVMAENLDDYSGATTARANHNFVASMFSLFSVVALALAALGVYAIVSHSVEERRREIGVRLALGASDGGVIGVILRDGNAFVLSGIALGLLLTRFTTTLLRAFLWVPEIDPFAIELFIPVAIGLFAVAVSAALAPAVRAARIDPVESLRCE